MVTIKGRQFLPLISEEQLELRIRELALQLRNDYAGKTPLFVVVLNGAFMFAAQLLKSFPADCTVNFIRVSSYHGEKSSGNINRVIGLTEDVTGRDIVLIEDIVDTGLTISYLVSHLKENGASSIEIATLLHKPEVSQKKMTFRYTGFEIPDRFVVGYGLDYDELGRNLNGIFILKE